MKNIIRIISASLLGVSVLASCSGFLEEKITTSPSEQAVFADETALEGQIFGIYAGLHTSNMFLAGFYEFFQPGSGLITWKGARTTDDWLSDLNFSRYSTLSNANSNWMNEIGAVINRCNRLIDNLPKSPVSDGFKTEIEAEAKFIRAFMYFTAVRVWGDYPLILKSPTTMGAELNYPRTAWYKVYCQIINDLEFAEENMCDHDDLIGKYRESRYLKGRPCNTAATALKASVYLTIGSLLDSPDDNFWDSSKDADLIAAGKDPRTPDFTPIEINTPADAYKKAYDAADAVITSGDYSLVDNYYKLFTWGARREGVEDDGSDWFLPERIFCLQSTDMAGTNWIAARTLPNYAEGTSATVNNSNWGRIRPSRYFINEFIRRTGGTKGTRDNDSEFYTTTKDPRFDASFYTSFTNTQGSKVTTYPKRNDSATSTSQRNDTYFAPFSRKYADPTYNVTKGKADMYIIRFAEMYLIRAEAAANLSSGVGDDMWVQALDDIETLHDRARNSYNPLKATSSSGPEYPSWDGVTFADKKELRDAIVWERFIELNFEGHEWFDTHRFGATWLRDNVAVPRNDFGETTYQNLVYTYKYKRTRIHPEDVQDIRKGLLNAYPERELRLNTSLGALDGQNDFYWQ